MRGTETADPFGRGSVRRRQLLIDTDPGVDDAIALLVAAASPEVELLAVTTVFGNVPVQQTTENALRILALAGADDIPVAAGAQRPLVHPQPHRAARVHGANGLGGVELPLAVRSAEATPAVRLLAELLHGSSLPVTVCSIGPLTNIALLLGTDPGAAARIERLVVMGGAYGSGDVEPAAEFNVWSDPEAAQRVLRSGLPITVVGLDVTRATAMNAAAIARIGASGPVGSAAAEMLAHHLDHYMRVQGGPGVVIHDALAVLEAVIPGVLGTVARKVTVDCGHGPGRGRTWVDRRTGPAPGLQDDAQSAGGAVPRQGVPVQVAETVDLPRALTEIEARLRSYGAR